MTACSSLRAWVTKPLEDFFSKLGRSAERMPFIVIGFSVVFSMLFASGVTQMVMESDSQNLWVPTSASSYKHRQEVKADYKGADRGITVMVTARDGGSMLREEQLVEALVIHTSITETIRSPEPPYGGYDDYCDRHAPGVPCRRGAGLLRVFGYSEAAIRAAASQGTLLPTIQSLERVAPLSFYLGGEQRDANDDLVGTNVVTLNYAITQYNTSDPVREDEIENVKSYELELMDTLKDEWNEDASRVTTTVMMTQRSVDDEIGRLIKVDSLLFAISINVIVVIFGCTLGRFNWVESRFTLGISAMLVVMLALGFSFGTMGWLGMPINAICFMIPFIVTGVGVDDLIVVESFFQSKVSHRAQGTHLLLQTSFVAIPRAFAHKTHLAPALMAIQIIPRPGRRRAETRRTHGWGAQGGRDGDLSYLGLVGLRLHERLVPRPAGRFPVLHLRRALLLLDLVPRAHPLPRAARTSLRPPPAACRESRTSAVV